MLQIWGLKDMVCKPASGFSIKFHELLSIYVSVGLKKHVSYISKWLFLHSFEFYRPYAPSLLRYSSISLSHKCHPFSGGRFRLWQWLQCRKEHSQKQHGGILLLQRKRCFDRQKTNTIPRPSQRRRGLWRSLRRYMRRTLLLPYRNVECRIIS